MTEDERRAQEIEMAGRRIENCHSELDEADDQEEVTTSPPGGIDTQLWLSDEVRNISIGAGALGILIGAGLGYLFGTRR